MKLGTVRSAGQQRIAVENADGYAVTLADLDLSVLDALRDWPAVRTTIEQWLATAGPGAPVDALDWLPPIPRPGKVLCVALNNSANSDRVLSGPSHPATFIKPSTSLLGHGQLIELQSGYGRVHPEPELAVVIGKGGKDISETDAYGHVFGYTIINDLTAPIMRGEDTFHYRAIHPQKNPDGTDGISYIESHVSYPGRYKGADGFGPIGPWIATADSVADPHDLRITCSHQGRLVTEDNTGNLLHKISDVIAFVSSYTTLEAGDIIAMGTALKASGGGGAVQNIDLTALGGPVDVEIEGIGRLSNPVTTK
jgi:2-keto-4-pentenoate hydratase/2-oxohepta-3-ene-1,7-dioic acid hydratase in catechol pathway